MYELRSCPARPIDGAESFLARARPGASERVDAGDAGRDSPILCFSADQLCFLHGISRFAARYLGTPPKKEVCTTIRLNDEYGIDV